MRTEGGIDRQTDARRNTEAFPDRYKQNGNRRQGCRERER